VVEGAKGAIKRQLEPMIHSADDVLLERHATFLRGGWILPRKVLIGELYNGSCDNGGFAFPFYSDLFLFGDFRRINFRRSVVQRPKILVDADVGCPAFIGRLGQTDFRGFRANRRFGEQQNSKAATKGAVDHSLEAHPVPPRIERPFRWNRMRSRFMRWRISFSENRYPLFRDKR